MKRALCVRLVAAMCGLSAAMASAQTSLDVKASGEKTFYADSRVGNNQITFFSESTLEDFTGVCNQAGGECSFDPKNIESFKGRFFLRVADLKTGIELRDTHMRGPDWLDAEKHPQITIDIQSVADVKKSGSDQADMTLVGECTIRGKTNAIRIPCSLKYLEETPETMRRVKGDLVRLRSQFTVKLSDYGVLGPQGAEKLIGLKVADDIEIKATIFGSTERPPDALKPDSPPDQGAAPPPPPRPGQKKP